MPSLFLRMPLFRILTASPQFGQGGLSVTSSGSLASTWKGVVVERAIASSGFSVSESCLTSAPGVGEETASNLCFKA